VSIPITPDATETETETDTETPDASISLSEDEDEEEATGTKEGEEGKEGKEGEVEKKENPSSPPPIEDTLVEQEAEDSVARPKDSETPLDSGSEGEVQLPNQKMAISPTSIESSESEAGESEAGESEAGESEAGSKAGESEAGESEAGESEEGSDAGESDAGESEEGSEAGSDAEGSDAGSSEGIQIYMGPDATEITLSMETVVKKLADENANWQEASKFVKHIGNFQDELGQTHIGVALDFELMSAGDLAMTTEKIILNLIQWMREMADENMPMFVAGHSLPPPGVIRPSPLMAVVFMADSDITGASLFHARQRRGGTEEKHATMVVVSSRGLVSPIVLATAALSIKRGYQAVAIKAPLGTVTFLHNIGFRAESKCTTTTTAAAESPEFNKTYEKMKEMLHLGDTGETESDRMLIYCL